jgi:hypothetical protein
VDPPHAPSTTGRTTARVTKRGTAQDRNPPTKNSRVLPFDLAEVWPVRDLACGLDRIRLVTKIRVLAILAIALLIASCGRAS